MELEDIQLALLTAAGVSEKAMRYINKEAAIKNLVEKFLIPAGQNFVEELVFRFLLTKGDSLGGSLRNLVGSMSERKLACSIIALINVSGISFYYCKRGTKDWLEGSTLDTSNETDFFG